MKNNLIGIKTYKNLGMSNSGYLVYEKTPLPPINQHPKKIPSS